MNLVNANNNIQDQMRSSNENVFFYRAGLEDVSPNDLDSINISDEEFEEIKEIEEFIKSMSN